MNKSIPHILIVDDDPNQLEILHEFLERKGFQPVSAPSGSAALALIEGERIDVALIDLQLGDISGLDVLRGIKERSPKTECILLTGHVSQKSAIEAIQMGAYGYFQKPFDMEQVLLFIQRAVEKQAAENALQESEARYRDLVENSQDLICTHDLQGNLLFVNEAGTKISGYSNEALLKMNLRELLAPEVRRQFDEYLTELQAKGQAHGLMRVQTAEGEIRYLEFKNTLQTEGLTTPIVRGMGRDVTERRRAEEALRKSEADLKEAQRVGRIGSWDWDAITDTIKWSEEYYRIYCLDPSQPPPGYEEHLKVYTAESASRLDAAVKNSMETGSPYELDLEYVCADGARRWVTARSEIKRDAKGQVVGLRGTALDITKRKQAEDALKESQQSYQKLVEQIPGVIYRDVLDEKASTLFIGPQIKELTGYAPKEWLADPDLWSKLLHPNDRARVLAENKHHIETGAEFKSDYRLLARDGRIVWVRDEAVSICDSSGQPLYDQGVFTDITERKQAEEVNKAHIHFLESLEQIDKAIRQETDIEQMLKNVMDRVLMIFNSDRAWLFYPCDPDAPTFRVPIEVNRPEYPGANALDLEVPMDPGVAKDLRDALASEDPISYTLGTEKPVNTLTAEQFAVQAQMFMAIYPKIGEPWVFGMHQCSHPRIWMDDEKALFKEIGHRVADGLSSVLFFRDLRESAEQLRSVFNQAADAIFLYDMKGNLLNVNQRACDSLGYTKEEFLEMNIADVDADFISRNHVSLFWSQPSYDQPVTLESIQKRKDGTTFPAEVRLGLLQINGKQSILALARDITERKQMEEALNQSEEKFRLLVENASEVFYQVSLENDPLRGEVVFVSPQVQAMTGHSVEEFLRDSELWIKSIFPEDLPGLFETTQTLITQRIAVTREYRMWNKSRDNLLWLSDHITPRFDAQGRLIGYQGIARDITERKQAEEALRTSQERFKTIFVQAPLGIALIGSLTGHIHEVNPRFAEIAGRSMEEMLNIDWMQITHPDDIQADLDNMALLNDGKINGFQMEKRYLHPDGTAVWINMTIAPLSVKDKANPRHLCMIEDITERKRAEDEIRQRVTELETLNRISVVLRTIASQDQLLAVVLDETLKALRAEHGAIDLWDKADNSLQKSMARGWLAEMTETSQKINEGIAGRVFISGENHISRDILNDPVTRASTRSQIPEGWGGICVSIRSTERILGTLLIAIPSERELDKDEIRLLNTLAEMTGASLHRMRLYEEALHRMKDLQALRDVDQAITSNFDLRPTLDTVITHAIAQLGVDAADILLLRPHLKFLEYAAGHGFRTPLAKGASVRLGDSLAGRAALERRTIHVSTLTEAHTNADFAAFWKSEGFAAYFCAPLLAKGEVKGVLEVYQRRPLPSEPEWLSYLETLAGQAAIAIDSTQLFDNLQRANLELGVAYETTIESWSRALSLRSSETEGHTLRVTEMVITLARSFNFSEEELQHIRRGTILHDIGKMGVPDQILLKPGPLTEEEWDVVRRHPQVAYDLLKPIAYLHDSLDIPYCHHEKWDGTGYPRGLDGDHIPLAARIFAVVDVYDALTNDRPFRKAWPNEKALEYIREQSGKYFDPQVVNVFLLEFGRKRSSVSGRPNL